MHKVALLKGYSSVDAFVREQMMAVNTNSLAAPRRPFDPNAVVVGHANDTVKRLVGVYRVVREVLAPLKVEMEAASQRLDQIMQASKDGAGLGALLSALADPALSAQLQSADAKAEEADALKLILSHVHNMISVEIALFSNVRGKGKPRIDENWNIVVEQKRSAEAALPPAVRELVAGFRRDGVEVKVIHVQN